MLGRTCQKFTLALGWFNEHLLIWLYLCYHLYNARRPYVVNRNMDNHPGKQYNHKTYDCVLAELLENLVLGMLLPKRGWGLTVDGV
jgi:hypothetical protein